jgi:hypothetical protein|tara:strand:+ start:251 stop:487 length:237 start_codon:yes stop_codon:yes gene_type:complete
MYPFSTLPPFNPLRAALFRCKEEVAVDTLLVPRPLWLLPPLLLPPLLENKMAVAAVEAAAAAAAMAARSTMSVWLLSK